MGCSSFTGGLNDAALHLHFFVSIFKGRDWFGVMLSPVRAVIVDPPP